MRTFILSGLMLTLGALGLQAAGPRAEMLAAEARATADTLTGGVNPNIPEMQLSRLKQLHPEVMDTLNCIWNNGKNGFISNKNDDKTFSNRPPYLPTMSYGSYREYTVTTPGAPTRGTRRIITDGEPERSSSNYNHIYYTDDHYNTFWLVIDDLNN